MKILLCCEDEDYIEVMRKIMTKYHFCEEREFEICLNVDEAIEKTNSIKFDIAFIDCLMNEENIMYVGKNVNKVNKSCFLFFMHTELDPTYICESFIIGTFQFLIKGEDDMMEREFLRASRTYAKEHFTFSYITKDMEKIQISPYDILYVELKKSPTIVATKKVIYRGWFKDEMYLVEHYLKEYNFLQIHSHYLVNMSSVMRIGLNEILMSNGDCLPVAVLKQEKVKVAFKQFVKW